MSYQEKFVFVDNKGNLLPENYEGPEKILAGSLTLAFISSWKKILLLKRSHQAEDMQEVWALHSGKLNRNDLTVRDHPGSLLSLKSFKNAVVREFMEELDLNFPFRRLKFLDKFLMEKGNKKFFFALFALAISSNEANKAFPKDSEIEKTGLFSLDEFKNLVNLGDAIKYKKNLILEFLENRFFPGRKEIGKRIF